jgi:hypothetical protein
MEEKLEMPYITEYTKFIKDYATGQVTGEEVGELVVRMAQYYAEHNLRRVMAEREIGRASGRERVCLRV